VIPLAAIAILTFVKPAQAQYIGDTYGLTLKLLNLGLVAVGDTGALLPGGGGLFTTHLLSANIGAGVSVGATSADLGATTGVIDTSTQGLGGVATSFARVNNLAVVPPLASTLQLSATVVRSDATANSGGTIGGSTITGLLFGSISINVTGAPNQTVFDTLGNKLVINEQIHNLDGSLTVNALDLTLLSSASQLRVSCSTAGFNGPATPEPGSVPLLGGLMISGGLFAIRRRKTAK
jgi:hypothetical protein